MSAANPAHLLIVDDDKEICALLSKLLGEYGYRISVAADGDAMMQILANARVDLVVLDILLPGRDGLVLCRELRSRGGSRSSC
jgi:two-component system, OmpR family, response regulator